MKDLKGKVVIVTGAGYGLGRGIALRLGAEGAKIATIGRTEEKLIAFRKEMSNRGYDSLYAVGDVSVRENISNLVRLTIEKWGRLDAVVNNAMTIFPTSVDDVTLSNMSIAWRSGVNGSLFLMQEAYPWFIRYGHGKVVNFCSVAGLQGHHDRVAYAAAKEAIGGLTRAAAAEWAKDNIQVNAIAPAMADPDSWNSFRKMLSKESIDAADSVYLGQSCGQNYEDTVGAATAFLISDDSNWITARTLCVDGGQAWLR